MIQKTFKYEHDSPNFQYHIAVFYLFSQYGKINNEMKLKALLAMYKFRLFRLVKSDPIWSLEFVFWIKHEVLKKSEFSVQSNTK